MPDELNLSNLKPAQARRDRKRIGRGQGSGKGRYSGRGIKGQKSRSGSHTMRAGFEGGQMPIYMRLGKARGPYSKDAMPMGPHRTYTAPVNLRDLERFDAGTEITPELLAQHGLVRNTRIDVKILGHGELTKKLTVTAHRFSATAREKIEGRGRHRQRAARAGRDEKKAKKSKPEAAQPEAAKPKRKAAATKEPAEAPEAAETAAEEQAEGEA
jgi:large subunit ribosomal protein L15